MSGAVIGSFLNVVIYRLPRGESIVFPSSHCTVCGTSIKWYDNIPVLSYLFLGGKCRACHEKISPVYPAVELFTALSAGLLVYRYGLTLQTVSALTLSAVLIVAFMIDLRYMIIPDTLNLFGAVAGLLLSFGGGISMLCRNLAGAVVGVISLLAMFFLGRLLYKRDGVGFGDVKLAAVMGLFIGPLWVLVSFLIAVVIGGIWGITYSISNEKRLGQEVPFGPFLAIGGFFVLFFSKELLYLISIYLSFW